MLILLGRDLPAMAGPMTRRPVTLEPSDGYAVPLFGTPEPAAQSLFPASLSVPSQTVRPVLACAACAGADCAGRCGAVALTLPTKHFGPSDYREM